MWDPLSQLPPQGYMHVMNAPGNPMGNVPQTFPGQGNPALPPTATSPPNLPPGGGGQLGGGGALTSYFDQFRLGDIGRTADGRVDWTALISQFGREQDPLAMTASMTPEQWNAMRQQRVAQRQQERQGALAAYTPGSTSNSGAW